VKLASLFASVLLLSAPAALAADKLACSDGTFSKAGRGACSHHGGIAKIICKDGTGATDKLKCVGHGGVEGNPALGSGGDEPGGVTESPTGATARCKDGLYSHAKGHTGACSHHGGVAKWLTPAKK
jgi:hypothetical protein